MNRNDNKNSATVTQGINLPDYFSCNHCEARKFEGQQCDAFQQAGRCRAAMLGMALSNGSVQIHLHLPVGQLPGGK